MEVNIESIVKRWSSLERPLFKGKLIDKNGCKCAQGDVLFCVGFTDKELKKMDQSRADKETAKALEISVTHSILLRKINDSIDGAPQIVLSNPKQILGGKADILLAFWFYLNNLSTSARNAAWEDTQEAAWEATWEATRKAAGEAASVAAFESTVEAPLKVAWEAAWASNEIQGMDILESKGHMPYFLAFFGFKTWDDVRKLTEK